MIMCVIISQQEEIEYVNMNTEFRRRSMYVEVEGAVQ